MSVLNQSGEEQVECPLCMEPLEVDDLNFFPCTCGYQICRFCWHRIRTDENGLCPACRKAYPENPADFKPLSQEEVAKLKAEKRHKDQQRKQRNTENRKHLANVRVVQRNLVFVVGLPLRLADSEVLKKHEYFGKFGKIHKVVINQSTSYAGSQGPSASAYVTYHRAEETLRAIQAVNNIIVDGRTIKASLGTTKYCSHFMKNQTCPKPDCMYLHELGDPEASFTKEEMQQGKHQEYERKLHEQLLNTYNQASKDRKPTPSPPAVALTAISCQNGNSSTSCTSSSPNPSSANTPQSCSKEAWPSLQPGVTTTASSNSGTDSSSCSLAGSSSNSSSNNSISNSSSGSNTHHTCTKAEGNGSRRQKFDHISAPKSSNTFKKRNNSSEESRMPHPEATVRTLDTDAIVTESDVIASSHISSEGVPGRVVSSGGRMLATGHRAATLFEPDNNSFFSTNSFTKVSASAAGSGPEWPMNGLTLTHMPDVLPPVHSSEDWQAAFGFSDSSSADGLQHRNSPGHQVAVEDSPASVAVYDATKDSDDNEQVIFESHNSQQIGIQGPIPVQGYISQSSHSTSLESITSNIVQNSPEVFRVNDIEHLNQKIGSFSLDDIPPGTDDCSSSSIVPLHPAVCSENSIAISPTSGHMYPGNHPAAFVQEQPVYVVNQHHFLSSATPSNQPHLMHNGILPSQVDYHLRQQSQVQNSQQPQIPLQILNQGILDGTNFNRHIVDKSAGSNFLTSGDCGSVVTSISNARSVVNLPSDADIDLVEEEENYPIADDENYSNFTSLEQQKSGVDNSSDDYLEFDRDSEIGEQEDVEDLNSIKDLNTRLTDDDLGFDPFHETQKALAEMMEKENMQMLRGQQNHIPHPTHINHLHHQYQQHLSHHPGQYNYAMQSINCGNNTTSSSSSSSSSSSNSSKVVSGYSASQHSLLAQQGNHRLQLNLSGCSKLIEGLGHVPPRARLPPPGFTTAPNHMNAFGLGIPRAPSNSGSKILPFMGLSNNTSSSTNGSSSPLPQPLNNVTNNIPHAASLNSQVNVSSPSILFPHPHGQGSTTGPLPNTFGLQNGSTINSTPPLLKSAGDTFTVKEWSENLRSLLPNLNDNGSGRQSPVSVPFPGRNSPSPPPCSQNSTYSSQSHPAVQSNTTKTWSSVGPCSDWTALDPAIMSSSRPHSYLASTAAVAPVEHPIILHNANSHLNRQSLTPQYLQIQTTTQWLRSLNGENCLVYGANSQTLANSDWSAQNHNSASNSIAPPPPGFTLRMNSTQQTTATVQNKATVPLTQEMTKIGS